MTDASTPEPRPEDATDRPARGVADMSLTRGKYHRRQVLLLLGLGIGLGLLGWSQRWFRLDGVAAEPIGATGSTAVPALLPLLLAALAAIVALLLAGRLARRILGGLIAVIGLMIMVLAVSANPVDALRAPVEQATSLTGADAIRALIESGEVASNHFIRWLTVFAGLLILGAGVLTVRTAWKWPVAGRKYSTTRFEHADGTKAGTPVDQWDALTSGEDPTTDATPRDPASAEPASGDPDPGDPAPDAPTGLGSDGPRDHQ